MKFIRTIESDIHNDLFSKKVILLFGARQVGKTTLVKKLLDTYSGSYFLCEESDVMDVFKSPTSSKLWSFFGNAKLIVLDEAQVIPSIGRALKLLHDTRPEVQIIATGSSSFSLAQKTSEALTGRNWEYTLFPLSISELTQTYGRLWVERTLEERLVFGSYPEVIATPENRVRVLEKLASDYLYRDILTYEGIRKPKLLSDLVRLLALQVGQTVSYNELAEALSVSRVTVSSYIDILEKAFVLFKLYPMHSNKRNEIKKQPKIFFWDTGIRNAALQNFQPLSYRSDVGSLFENFIISEFMKKRAYSNHASSVYFWRTKQGQEVDFVEVFNGGSRKEVYECKWSKKISKAPAEWVKDYENVPIRGINKDNFLEYLL